MLSLPYIIPCFKFDESNGTLRHFLDKPANPVGFACHNSRARCASVATHESSLLHRVPIDVKQLP